jgi:hypothetical protein
VENGVRSTGRARIGKTQEVEEKGVVHLEN